MVFLTLTGLTLEVRVSQTEQYPSAGKAETQVPANQDVRNGAPPNHTLIYHLPFCEEI